MPGFHDITAAIVGAGFIGPVHVEGLRRLGIRVKGIAGISLDEAQRAAATLGLPRAYASADELFAELDTLFNEHNQATTTGTTRIPATFLRVTVQL